MTMHVADVLVSVHAAREMFRYMEWADSRVWNSVLAHDAAREDAVIRDYLLHLHTVQQVFLALWMNESLAVGTRKASDFADLKELLQWAQPYYAKAQQFLETADAATLTQPVVMPWLKEYEQQMGKTFAVPMAAETIFQVVNHTTHHRAQISARLRTLAGEPPLVDYIGWVWFGKPAPEWQGQ